MKIYTEINNSNICVVIPVIDIDDFHKSDFYNFLRANKFCDFIILESSNGFHFSKVMNAGIEKALSVIEYEYIILSTDNIHLSFADKSLLYDLFKKGLNTIKYMPDLKIDYFVPMKVNGYGNSFLITKSLIHYLYNSLIEGLPFYSLKKYIRMKKERLPNMFIARTKHGIPDIMPFSIFSRECLENYRFDTNIKNSLEDNELSLRLFADKENVIT